MRKYIVQWSLLLLSICLLRLAAPAFMLHIAGVDFNFAVYGSLIALFAIVFTGKAWQHIDFRAVFKAGSFISLILGALCLYSPTFGSIRESYVSLADIFILFESSLILGFAALREKQDDALPVVAAVALTVQLLARRVHTSAPTGKQLQTPRYS